MLRSPYSTNNVGDWPHEAVRTCYVLGMHAGMALEQKTLDKQQAAGSSLQLSTAVDRPLNV